MANKLYQIAFQLGAKIASNFNSSFSSAGKQLNNLEQESTKANKSFLGLGEGMGKLVKAAAGFAGAYVGISAIKDFANDSIQAAQDQIEQQTKLETILKNVRSIQAQGPNAYKAATTQIIGMADQLQKVGVINKDVSTAGYQQLATFQLGSKEIGILSGGMADLLAQQKGFNATSGDAVSIANMMGKVMDGNVGALKKVGISFTNAQAAALKTGNSIQKATVLAQVLKDNVGGVNAALRNTDPGKIWAAKNAFTEMKVEIGKELIPLQAKFAGWFARAAPIIEKVCIGIIDVISSGLDYISKGADGLSSVLSPFFKMLEKESQGITKNLNAFKPLISVYRKYFTSLFSSIVNTLKEVSPKLISFGTSIANSFMKLLPSITKVTASITNAVIKILPTIRSMVEFIVNNVLPPLSQAFNFIATKVVPEVANAFAKWMPKIADFINNLWIVAQPIIKLFIMYIKVVAAEFFTEITGILKILGELASGIFSILDGIVKFIAGVFTGNWSKAWSGVTEIFSGIVGTLGAIIKAPLNSVIIMINEALAGINQISFKVPDWIPGLGGKQFGVHIPQIPMLANGGYIKHRAGGILANIGEGSEDEVVSPVSKLKDMINNGTTQQPGITFAPQIIIQGNASKDDVEQALNMSQSQFERMLDNYFKKRQRLSLNHN